MENEEEKRVVKLLKEEIEIFKSRDEEYGSVYKTFGVTLKAYFPDGITLLTEEDFTRFGALTTLLAKIQRYTANFKKGGSQRG